MVGKWVITHLSMGFSRVYKPLTNLLLTSWDIPSAVFGGDNDPVNPKVPLKQPIL